ncbi:MAG: molybdenum cofactor guanylyltransferase [Gammaproteobacteria bacterium]|nr:molybdenum cofactor guanylyltransferase [Gammaproteobacteria bacterium]MDE0273383.1 molybdenum cofactor guanylyltransferase [Gammaproteobacteria bacterium]
MTQITGIILCGGRGRRLGGVDKPLQLWGGQTLAAWIAERLRPQVNALLISANRNLEAYRLLAPVVADELPPHQGPLAGVAAALRRCATPLALVCPGDAPLVPLDLAKRLHTALEAHSADSSPLVAVAHDGERRHPLHCLLRAEAIGSLDRYLASGGRAAHGWLDSMGAVDVQFKGQEEAFRNFNSRRDFEEVPAPAKEKPS